MIMQLRAGSIPETSFYKDWVEERPRLGLPKDCERLLHRAQMALLADTGADADVVGNFFTPRNPGELRALGRGFASLRFLGY